MDRPRGTVSASGRDLAVQLDERFADDYLWSDILNALGSVEFREVGAAAFVPATTAARLFDALSTYPASQVRWEWDAVARKLLSSTSQAIANLNTLATSDQHVCQLYTNELRAEGFKRALRPFQENALARLVSMGNGADFSVPGAGKTTVALALYSVLRSQKKVSAMVVVAPPSAFESWQTEAAACFMRRRRPAITLRDFGAVDETQIAVVNYERLELQRTLAEIDSWLRERQALVVFDEAHRAKAGSAGVRGSMARRLTERATRRLVMTGTPMPNSVDDLAAIMDLVWPGQGTRLASGDLASVRDRAYVRVTKNELGLPPLAIRTERVTLEPAHLSLCNALANRDLSEIQGVERDAAETGRSVMRLLAAATNPAAVLGEGGTFRMPEWQSDADLEKVLREPTFHIRPAKIVRTAQIVSQNATSGRKTLVWSNFLRNIDALRDALAVYQPAVVTGSTPVLDASAPTDRARELAKFRTDPECMVLIATPQTLGEGVSLHQVCFDQVHVDRGFSAGIFLQSLDRTHRLGMAADSAPTCTVLVAAGTIDERCEVILSRKVLAMSEALNDTSLKICSEARESQLLSLEDILLDDMSQTELVRLLQHVIA